MEETIKDWNGWILGYVETKPNGDKVARDFYKKILGYYRKSLDVTTDFFGRRLTKGDSCSSLVYAEAVKKKSEEQIKKELENKVKK